MTELEKLEKELMNAERVSYAERLTFPSKPGVYLAFEDDELVYVGETANINDRMRDMSRTYNHTFRIHIGKKVTGKKVPDSGKYEPDEEKKITDYFNKHITLSCLVVELGRRELEEVIIRKRATLYNRVSKR